MYAFVVFLGLALGLTVVMQVLDELIPFKVLRDFGGTALTRTGAVVLAAGMAWTLDYSVFAAFEQPLREQWMHPWFTGLVLVGGGEFVRTVIAALSHRAGEPPVEVAPAHRIRSAA